MSLSLQYVGNSMELIHPRLKQFWGDLKKILPEAKVYETLRSNARQTFLYEQGRSRPGEIVTYAKAGDSPHNHGLAFDIVGVNFNTEEKEIRNLLKNNSDVTWGKDFWRIDTKTKKKVRFPDPSHFQIKNWRSKVMGLKPDFTIPIIAIIGFSIYKFRGNRK